MSVLRTGRALFIDVEMTCWKGEIPPGQRREIIEFGLVEVDTAELVILREATYLVRPRVSEVSEYCTALTGITPQEVKRDGRPLEEVLRTMAKDFGPARKPLLAWGNDWVCLQEDCEAAGCVNPFPREAFTDIGRVGTLLWGSGGRLGLDKARAILGLESPDGRHRALIDARATAELYMSMATMVRAYAVTPERNMPLGS